MPQSLASLLSSDKSKGKGLWQGHSFTARKAVTAVLYAFLNLVHFNNYALCHLQVSWIPVVWKQPVNGIRLNHIYYRDFLTDRKQERESDSSGGCGRMTVPINSNKTTRLLYLFINQRSQERLRTSAVENNVCGIIISCWLHAQGRDVHHRAAPHVRNHDSHFTLQLHAEHVFFWFVKAGCR